MLDLGLVDELFVLTQHLTRCRIEQLLLQGGVHLQLRAHELRDLLTGFVVLLVVRLVEVAEQLLHLLVVLHQHGHGVVAAGRSGKRASRIGCGTALHRVLLTVGVFTNCGMRANESCRSRYT